jgi:DNA polymerase
MASITRLRAEAADCTRCDLYRGATQTVFGEGPARPRLVLIGEQPGDKEDLDGHPFVGPAGRLLDRALAAAGIDRDRVYVTNAVKHFKWKRGSGKVRLHQKPTREEVRACAPWWEAELAALRPELVVLLGATAAQAVLGPKVRVTRDRGQVLPAHDELPYDTMVTIHPSAVLRTKPPERDVAFDALVRDLRVAAQHSEP